MIAHVVLFRPRADLSTLEAAQLIDAFEQALLGIPMIRRSSVGRRITIGRDYEQLMRTDFPYAAILEFDDVAGLREYLAHPAHSQIGAAVFAAAADILVYDFEMGVGTAGLTAARDAAR